MTVIATIPALFAIVGALVFVLAGNPSAKELGRIAFACGLLVTLGTLVGHVVRF